jgi:hypothetical protein
VTGDYHARIMGKPGTTSPAGMHTFWITDDNFTYLYGYVDVPVAPVPNLTGPKLITARISENSLRENDYFGSATIVANC